MEVLSYGGIVQSLQMPDRNGQLADVALGFESLEPYLAGHPFFGAITGRVAGRIPGGRFTLGGKTYELVKNDGPNHLHGGLEGLDKRNWSITPNEREDGADSVRLTYLSPDGEEGYPGTAFFCLNYTLTQDNVFLIESEVTSDCAWAGKSGQPYLPFAGLCLECEGYPAAVDFPEFGSIIVTPGQPQRRTTRYAFSTDQS